MSFQSLSLPSPPTVYPYSHSHFSPSPPPPHSPRTAACTLLCLTHLLHPVCSHPRHFSPSTKLASTPTFFPHAQHTQRSSGSLTKGCSAKGWSESECGSIRGLKLLRRVGSGEEGGDRGDGARGGWMMGLTSESAMSWIMSVSVAGGSSWAALSLVVVWCCWRTCWWWRIDCV
jgi:hypothetical protein